MLSNLEIKRKAVHLFVGVFLALFYYFGFISWRPLLLLIAVALIVSHYAKNHFVPVVDWFLDKLERPKDKKEFPGRGAIMLLIGSFLAIVLFPRDVAVASIMILALGDAISALLGPFGSIPHPWNKVKVIEGMIAGAIAGFVGAAVFVPYPQAFWASFIAMALETLDLEFFDTKIDDNVMIPLVAGIVMILMRGNVI